MKNRVRSQKRGFQSRPSWWVSTSSARKEEPRFLGPVFGSGVNGFVERAKAQHNFFRRVCAQQSWFPVFSLLSGEQVTDATIPGNPRQSSAPGHRPMAAAEYGIFDFESRLRFHLPRLSGISLTPPQPSALLLLVHSPLCCLCSSVFRPSSKPHKPQLERGKSDCSEDCTGQCADTGAASKC